MNRNFSVALLDITVFQLAKTCSPRMTQELWEVFQKSFLISDTQFQSKEERVKAAVKLHRQFCHPDVNKLKSLLNSSCPTAQNTKLLCYSQSKNRLHRNPLYFVTTIVGAGNREGKLKLRLQSALGCDGLKMPI